MRLTTDEITADDIILEVANQANVRMKDLHNLSWGMISGYTRLHNARCAALYAVQYSLGWSPAEIACHIGTSAASVNNCLKRARKNEGCRQIAERALAYLKAERAGESGPDTAGSAGLADEVVGTD